MSRIEKYIDWIQIKIDHEYYNISNIPLKLFPSKETIVFFDKSGILFRQYAANNQWNILLPTGELAEKQLTLWLEDNVTMNFELSPSSNDFLYTSSLQESENEYHSIKNNKCTRIWKQLEIPFTHLILKQTLLIDVLINSVKKYLEFILIPKYNSIDIQLQLVEEQEKIQFNEIKKINLLDHIEAYQFKTIEPVALKENNSYKLKLWETRKTGNRLLSDTIYFPRYDEISPIDSFNTITTYFYY